MYAFLIFTGFFGGIAVLIALVVALIRRKPKKPLLIALAVCFAALVVGVAIAPPTAKAQTPSAAPATSDAEATSEVSETVSGPTMEETLTTLANDSLKNKKVPISVVLNDGACVVHCEAPEDTAYFNEVDLVRSHISAYIKFCKAAYETGAVKSVDWWAQVKMLDSRGNESVDKVIQLEMPKDAFEAYNWENMEYKKGMYQQFSSDCSTCYVHPGILGKIDTDNDIFYVP